MVSEYNKRLIYVLLTAIDIYGMNVYFYRRCKEDIISLTSKMTMMLPSLVENPVSSPSLLSFPTSITPSSTNPTLSLISSSQIYSSAMKATLSDDPGM
jgi:hypothetical protein